MDKANDQVYSRHILKAIEGIVTFTQGLTFEDFKNDLKTQFAVTRELEIIGEVAKRLSEKFKEEHSHIPWRKISGMRDFLIHDYTEIDLKEVWKAVIEDVPELAKELEKHTSPL